VKFATLELIFRALNRAGVRYLVAGGLAVNAHGYQRLTADLDMVIQLDRANILAAFEALSELGYRPIVPVTSEQFSKPEQRRQWIEQKGMQVLNLSSNAHPDTTVDVFVTEPFDFDREYAVALRAEIAPKIEVRFVSVPTLISMKDAAGRPRDRDDIEHLRWILEEQGRHG
jgi:hypothetical protein